MSKIDYGAGHRKATDADKDNPRRQYWCERRKEWFNELPHTIVRHGVEYRVPIERAEPNEPPSDPVNHPAHYTSHPSGIEAIQVAEHMSFNLGNAIKYIWRADLKGDAIEDLKKAAWYVNREIEKRTRAIELERGRQK